MLLSTCKNDRLVSDSTRNSVYGALDTLPDGMASPYHMPHRHTNGSLPTGSGSPLAIKSSSCSTIFLDDSTISQPNLKNTIKCISLAIYYHIVNRSHRGCERVMDIFDEKRHPLTRDGVAHDYDRHDPEMRYINRYIRALFNNAQLTSECAIITLVYIERLLTYAEIDLCPANWRRIVLGAILLGWFSWVFLFQFLLWKVFLP